MVQVVLPMSRPFKHPDTDVYDFRKAVPADLRAIIGKCEGGRHRAEGRADRLGPVYEDLEREQTRAVARGDALVRRERRAFSQSR
jgi:hypothetical protein